MTVIVLYLRNCLHCGIEFTPKDSRQKCCCDKHGKKYYASLHLKAKSAEQRVFTCEHCGQQFVTDHKRRFCNDDCRYAEWWGRERAKPVTRVCLYCGQQFETTSANQYCCCAKHGRKIAAKRRKANKKGVAYEPYSREYVFERDNYVCHICGGPLQMDAVAPHPLSPSIDHVYPISKGGSDTLDNVKAAHFLCNSNKRDIVGYVSGHPTQGGEICFTKGPRSDGVQRREKISPMEADKCPRR